MSITHPLFSLLRHLFWLFANWISQFMFNAVRSVLTSFVNTNPVYNGGWRGKGGASRGVLSLIWFNEQIGYQISWSNDDPVHLVPPKGQTSVKRVLRLIWLNNVRPLTSLFCSYIELCIIKNDFIYNVTHIRCTWCNQNYLLKSISILAFPAFHPSNDLNDHVRIHLLYLFK